MFSNQEIQEAAEMERINRENIYIAEMDKNPSQLKVAVILAIVAALFLITGTMDYHDQVAQSQHVSNH